MLSCKISPLRRPSSCDRLVKLASGSGAWRVLAKLRRGTGVGTCVGARRGPQHPAACSTPLLSRGTRSHTHPTPGCVWKLGGKRLSSLDPDAFTRLEGSGAAFPERAGVQLEGLRGLGAFHNSNGSASCCAGLLTSALGNEHVRTYSQNLFLSLRSVVL